MSRVGSGQSRSSNITAGSVRLGSGRVGSKIGSSRVGSDRVGSGHPGLIRNVRIDPTRETPSKICIVPQSAVPSAANTNFRRQLLPLKSSKEREGG